MKIPSEQYNIGYSRPPEHSKWKKGQSGNPKRVRKRPVKPVATIIDEFFASKVDVFDNGIPQQRSAFAIIYLQLCNKAIAGNTRALNVLTKYNDFAAKSRFLG